MMVENMLQDPAILNMRMSSSPFAPNPNMPNMPGPPNPGYHNPDSYQDPAAFNYGRHQGYEQPYHMGPMRPLTSSLHRQGELQQPLQAPR
jgi:hypothetical protein